MLRVNIEKLGKIDQENLVSIYMPTYKKSPDSAQNRIRFKNLLGQAEDLIKEKNLDPDPILKEGYKLHDDLKFWDHVSHGLAVLLGSDEPHIIKMSRQPSEYVTFEDRFRIVPLLNDYEQLNDTFILDIAKDRFELYFGDQAGIREVEIQGVEKTFNELFPITDTQYALDGQSGNVLFYRRKDKSDLKEDERIKFFRHVAEALREFIGPDMPLVLFGTTENVATFKEIGDVLEIRAAVEKPISSMDLDEAHEELRLVLQPKYVEKIGQDLEQMRSEIAAGNGTDNISRIKRDSETGRISRLFVGSNFDDLRLEETDKLIQDVLKADGEVTYVSNDYNDFPEKLTALYRF